MRFKLLLTSLVMLPLLAFADQMPMAEASQGVPTTRPGPHAAQISGHPGFPVRELFAVRFVNINGVNIRPRETIWLEPGSYTLKVQIDADHVFRPRPARGPTRSAERGYNEIELELVAGKTYEIRALHDPTNRRAPFSVVLHQVREK